MRRAHELYDGEDQLLERSEIEIPREQAVAMIKAEAGRRIEARYPISRQLNIMVEGGEPLQAMRAWIDAVRATSNEMEKAMPGNFTDDKHWPS
jgi:hypothetical protein